MNSSYPLHLQFPCDYYYSDITIERDEYRRATTAKLQETVARAKSLILEGKLETPRMKFQQPSLTGGEHDSALCSCDRKPCSLCSFAVKECCLDEHREIVCWKRLVTCPYCHIQHDAHDGHYDRCPKKYTSAYNADLVKMSSCELCGALYSQSESYDAHWRFFGSSSRWNSPVRLSYLSHQYGTFKVFPKELLGLIVSFLLDLEPPPCPDMRRPFYYFCSEKEWPKLYGIGRLHEKTVVSTLEKYFDVKTNNDYEFTKGHICTKRFKCPLPHCKQLFSSSEELDRHARQQCDYEVKCQSCNRFVGKLDLESHLNSCVGKVKVILGDCSIEKESPYSTSYNISTEEKTHWEEERRTQDEAYHKFFTIFEYDEDYGIGLVRIERPLLVEPKDFYIPNRAFMSREERERRVSERKEFAMPPIDISHLLTNV